MHISHSHWALLYTSYLLMTFQHSWSFLRYLHSILLLSPLLPFLFLLLFLLVELISMKMQFRLWIAPVHSPMDAPALCDPHAHLGALQSLWWRWHRSPSSLGHASLNTLGSSTCFLSERLHHYGRYAYKNKSKGKVKWSAFLHSVDIPEFVCLSTAGRWCQWLPPLIHCRSVCNGSSSCSSPGWQCSGVLQHERVCVYGKSKQEPGTHAHHKHWK